MNINFYIQFYLSDFCSREVEINGGNCQLRTVLSGATSSLHSVNCHPLFLLKIMSSESKQLAGR